MMIHDILMTHLSGKVICRMNSADKMFKTQGILMATSPCKNNTVGICSFAGNETRENHETDFKSVDGVHISLGRNSSADHSITHDNITTGLVVLGLPAFYLKGEASEENNSNYVSEKNSNNALKVFTGSEMPVKLDPKSFKGNDFTFFHEKSSYNKINASETSTFPVRIKAEHLEMDDITYDCHLKGSGKLPVIENSGYVNQSSYLHNNFCAGVSQSNLLSVSSSLKVKPESVGSSQTHWKVSFCNSEGQTLENKMNLLGDFPVDIFDHIPLKYRLGTFELHHDHYRDIVDNVPLKYRLGTSEFHSDSPLNILDDVSLKYGDGTIASEVGFNSSIDNYLSENIYPVSSVSHSFESINTTASYSSSRRKSETSSLTSDSHSFGSVDGKARFSISRRKRKKTATDSVEKALEEDAPGLLQVLLDRGIQVEEIKLYGDIEGEDSLEETFSEDNFEELESLMTKLFSERSSLLGLALRRSGKGSKTVYCLASLISLIEQCRYLLFRQTPVEWGWCRDLQSFIFVFKTHNRIVLERPEYGYATYFFEIVSSLPIDWQVKRLVMAMKLTNCSRTILLENKPLIVGEDLSEGEARVLGEYGWVPNTGIGTLLNYCDRVVHDRINEVHNCDWRAKIGKILKNGYDRGCLVLTNIPRKAAEYMQYQGTEVKLEP